nr:uncharacterized protein LOC110131675 isoform X1 [Odocoileus virginianus texanus]
MGFTRGEAKEGLASRGSRAYGDPQELDAVEDSPNKSHSLSGSAGERKEGDSGGREAGPTVPLSCHNTALSRRPRAQHPRTYRLGHHPGREHRPRSNQQCHSRATQGSQTIHTAFQAFPSRASATPASRGTTPSRWGHPVTLYRPSPSGHPRVLLLPNQAPGGLRGVWVQDWRLPEGRPEVALVKAGGPSRCLPLGWPPSSGRQPHLKTTVL